MGKNNLVQTINEITEALDSVAEAIKSLEANWGEGLFPMRKLSIDAPHETTDLHDALRKIIDYLEEVVFRIQRMASEIQALRRAIGLPDRDWTGEESEST